MAQYIFLFNYCNITKIFLYDSVIFLIHLKMERVISKSRISKTNVCKTKQFVGKESWNWMSLLYEVFVIPIKIFVWGGGVGGFGAKQIKYSM